MNRDIHPAALRILESTPPERIRTHVAHPPIRISVLQGRPKGDLPAKRRATIAELRGQINPATGAKWKQREIGALLGISQVAVRKHMRALDGGKYRGGTP